MGVLLMQFEYQRAIQKKTVLEHKGVRLNNMHDLYTKRIANIEKLFSKKKTQLESKYTRLSSQLTASLNRLSATNMLNEVSIGSLFAANGISNKLIQGVAAAAGADISNINPSTAATTQTEQKSSILSQQAAIIAQVQAALNTILEQLKEADLEDLEAKEDAQTAPIAEKDADMQAEIAVNDTRLTMADERAQAAKQRLAQVAKDSMAHYGLS